MTPDSLTTWVMRHNISPLAVAELRAMMIGEDVPIPALPGTSEAAIQNEIRMEASAKGCRLWRNNIGAGKLENGSFVRWGLCNDSEAVNKQVKSSDLIGIRPVLITQAHVGQVIGQFLSREVKEAGWKFRGTEREIAQERWHQIITGLGGDSRFAAGRGTI